MFKSMEVSLLVVALTAATAVLPSEAAFAQTASANEVVGLWEADNGSLKLDMFDAGGTYSARMLYGIRVMEPDGKTFRKDTNNPDPNLRTRSLERAVILKNLKWNAEERRWEGGSLYDGSSGRSVSARATMVKGKMELRAYLGTPIMGRTVTFHRVKS
ncbi:DUF2147 domain-containing protein [Sphingomonas prati]|uniref:Uncharacterized protein (DUF2147 family) n=1 Tax=Sphingomonas prati TaxID=1843237 RepID=A0A7W9BS34_9SPHN|nr:DUF2147 domain-containing protein [Sphingomonas prati]MBB5729060.1 uncharacterized protein (DUF2147 family) [Sphingomonas prati]GGE85414.1 hypothetical protein GCM10011404_17730 [Sphingomonas prati]